VVYSAQRYYGPSSLTTPITICDTIILTVFFLEPLQCMLVTIVGIIVTFVYSKKLSDKFLFCVLLIATCKVHIKGRSYSTTAVLVVTCKCPVSTLLDNQRQHSLQGSLAQANLKCFTTDKTSCEYVCANDPSTRGDSIASCHLTSHPKRKKRTEQ
jgi:hypothetical protein